MVLGFLSSLSIILLRKRELVTLLFLSDVSSLWCSELVCSLIAVFLWSYLLFANEVLRTLPQNFDTGRVQ